MLGYGALGCLQVKVVFHFCKHGLSCEMVSITTGYLFLKVKTVRFSKVFWSEGLVSVVCRLIFIPEAERNISVTVSCL